MKKASLLIVLILSSFVCFSQKISVCDKEPFYCELVSDFSFHGYHLVLNISTEDFTGKALVANGELYRLLNNSQKLTIKNYTEKVLKVLKSGGVLHLPGVDLNSSDIIPIADDALLMCFSDKSTFIQRFFSKENDRYVLKKWLNRYEPEIVGVLFKWRIPCKSNDESGYLYFEERWLQ